MSSELYKREVLLRETEQFEFNHGTVLRDFRRANHFPIPRGKEGIVDRFWQSVRSPQGYLVGRRLIDNPRIRLK